MALTVEDGSGKSDADSYLSVAGADTYHTNHSGSSNWSGADTATKEKALRLATQYLDMVYFDRWQGARVSQDQRLDWPRAFVVIDGFGLASDELPQQLLDACAELGLLEITETAGLIPDLTDPGIIGRELVKIGPITSDITYQGGNSPVKTFRTVEALLQRLLAPSGELHRS